ncbi:hypothetical protein E1890_22710 [Salmonella enterica subsp. enterica serovar Mountpleasant]|nr:hypothetical protein [Salmonella enterica subsp. enterica serovar Mountpleasant]
MNLKKIYKIQHTMRLYNLDTYKREEHAKVLYVDNSIAVFDQTIFYAESGGQIYDTDSIDGNRVVSVKKHLEELSKKKKY